MQAVQLLQVSSTSRTSTDGAAADSCALQGLVMFCMHFASIPAKRAMLRSGHSGSLALYIRKADVPGTMKRTYLHALLPNICFCAHRISSLPNDFILPNVCFCAHRFSSLPNDFTLNSHHHKACIGNCARAAACQVSISITHCQGLWQLPDPGFLIWRRGLQQDAVQQHP